MTFVASKSLGKWVIGPEGLTRFDRMRRNLETVELSEVSLYWKGIAAFEPWMSSTVCIERVTELGWKPKSIVTAVTGRIEPFIINSDQDVLRLHLVINDVVSHESSLQVPLSNSSSLESFQLNTPLSLKIIKDWSPHFYRKVQSACQWIGPLETKQGTRSLKGRGISSHAFRHCILLEAPNIPLFEAETLALNIAHEIAHQFLQVYQASDLIIQEAFLRKPIFSVIRQVERPAILSFHAMLACIFMTEWTNEALSSNMPNPAQRKWLMDKHQENMKASLDGVLAFEGVPLTKLGSEILSECRTFLSLKGN